MKLIGMLDSPYVRRVAISMRAMGLQFDHDQISVFSQYDEFERLNPVVKAPTLITDDGVVLMESSIILEFVEDLASPERRLRPEGRGEFARAQRIVGLALIACEKTVQIVYERNLRPAEKFHQPWIDRVSRQLLSAYRLLEAEAQTPKGWLFGTRPLQADISLAVAWRFTQSLLPEVVSGAEHRVLAALSERAEALEVFRKTPYEGT